MGAKWSGAGDDADDADDAGGDVACLLRPGSTADCDPDAADWYVTLKLGRTIRKALTKCDDLDDDFEDDFNDDFEDDFEDDLDDALTFCIERKKLNHFNSFTLNI